MEQAEAEAGVFNDVGLVLAQAVVAFCRREPAPDSGSDQVAGDLLAREVLQVVGLQLGFGVLQLGLEGFKLLGADASGSELLTMNYRYTLKMKYPATSQ